MFGCALCFQRGPGSGSPSSLHALISSRRSSAIDSLIADLSSRYGDNTVNDPFLDDEAFSAARAKIDQRKKENDQRKQKTKSSQSAQLHTRTSPRKSPAKAKASQFTLENKKRKSNQQSRTNNTPTKSPKKTSNTNKKTTKRRKI